MLRIFLVSPLVPATDSKPSAVVIAHAYRAGARTLVRREVHGCLRGYVPRKLLFPNEKSNAVFFKFSNMISHENRFTD